MLKSCQCGWVDASNKEVKIIREKLCCFLVAEKNCAECASAN